MIALDQLIDLPARNDAWPYTRFRSVPGTHYSPVMMHDATLNLEEIGVRLDKRTDVSCYLPTTE
jgi:hypothetical protein